jgi:prophage regulatory protein
MSLEHAPQRAGFRLLRRREVCDRLGISAATLYRWVQQGIIKPPLQVGPNTTGWTENDVDEIITARAEERDRQLELDLPSTE